MTYAISILAQLGAQSTSGVHLQKPCDDSAIQLLQAEAVKELGEKIPEAFLRLLKATNGVQINGAYFKEAENLVPENLDLSCPEIIVLGTEGNVAQFVFDRRDRRFHTINMSFPDERFASYDTFDDMLVAVLKEQQVL